MLLFKPLLRGVLELRGVAPLARGVWDMDRGVMVVDRGVIPGVPSAPTYLATEGCDADGTAVVECPCTRSMSCASCSLRSDISMRRPSRVYMALRDDEPPRALAELCSLLGGDIRPRSSAFIAAAAARCVSMRLRYLVQSIPSAALSVFVCKRTGSSHELTGSVRSRIERAISASFSMSSSSTPSSWQSHGLPS